MKKTIITLIVIAAIAGSVGAYYYTRPGPEPKVSTAQVSRGDITEVVSATGTLDAVTAVTVGSQVGGIIQELGENGVRVDFNSFVKKGQVLLQINPDAINTQIEQANATLVQRQADLERSKVSVEDCAGEAEADRGAVREEPGHAGRPRHGAGGGEVGRGVAAVVGGVARCRPRRTSTSRR